ncbi:hypothetical protein F5Y11DRAFT_325449 [Daldinia sp. FL1419]|nr:hypothetical protein F5Y11DRAFT_325449 [Daldinia sp. FL1419]
MSQKASNAARTTHNPQFEQTQAMETKGVTAPPTPIFRIRVTDTVIEVPIQHDGTEELRIEDPREPHLLQQPVYFSSSPPSKDNTSSDSQTHTTNKTPATSQPLLSPRTTRFQKDFLALLTLLPPQRYPSSPSSPTPSFCSATETLDREESSTGASEAPLNSNSGSQDSKEGDGTTVLVSSTLGEDTYEENAPRVMGNTPCKNCSGWE